MEFKHKTETSFDKVLNLLEETEVVSGAFIMKICLYVIKTKELIENSKGLPHHELIEIFDKQSVDFYDALQIYEPIFSQGFRIWLLKSFRNLKKELI